MQKEFLSEIKDLILTIEDKELLKELLLDYHENDIAEVLEELDKEHRLFVYQAVGVERTAEIFLYYDDVEDYVLELSNDKVADIVEQMDADDAIDVLNELEDDDKEEIINLMDEDSKNIVQKIDSYDEDVIGSYMSDNYITISKDLTIKEAMKILIKEAGVHDNIQTIYVIDNDKFYGAITLRDLIIARNGDNLLDLCMTSYPSFYDYELMSDCIRRLKDYAEDSIPVLSKDNVLLGVITQDSVTDALDEEMTDDYAKLGGLTESEDLDESVFSSIKKRIPWLIVLLFLGFIVSSVIGGFETVIAALPAIVFFQSMILGMAGNSGTQSLAVTIRNITNEEIKGKDIAKNVLKEIRIGFSNGFVVSIIAFIFAFLYLFIRKQEIVTGNGFLISDVLKTSLIISISLIVSMTLASFIGTIFPIFLDKIHIDPAVASGPFITTFNDIVAVLVYYGLTTLLFLIFL